MNTPPAPDERPLVLIVDDHRPNRELLAAWLGRTYRVATAVDGQDALDLVDRLDPDVVLLDVMMPVMDGLETCRRIKERQNAPFLPVLLVTALGAQVHRNAGLAAGADEFLTRPVDPGELALRVAGVVRLRRQDQLIRTQLDELRRLDQLKEDLVALVSHDLLNALAGLLLMMESLQYKGDTFGTAELSTMFAAAGRMHLTLQDMLRVKQLEDGALRLERTPITFAEVVDGALALADPKARARGVSFERTFSPDLCIDVDAILLERSLFNLVQNAVHHSPRGSTVEIHAEPHHDEIVIEVRDRGPGVPEELRTRLFEKYAGVAARRARGTSGHGLGLFLVQLVSRAHGGDVEMVPRDGAGSIFRMRFPLTGPDVITAP